jgi:holo-[acyl-carrier protein] synthase
VPELRNEALGGALESMITSLIRQRVGVDAIHLPSWTRCLEVGGQPFLRRVYSDAELDACGGDAERLAARFAGKEAVLKVLGTGIEGVGLGAVEVLNETGGRPTVSLSGGAAEVADRLSLSAFELSLSHEQDYALAIATARQETSQ